MCSLHGVSFIFFNIFAGHLWSFVHLTVASNCLNPNRYLNLWPAVWSFRYRFTLKMVFSSSAVGRWRVAWRQGIWKSFCSSPSHCRPGYFLLLTWAMSHGFRRILRGWRLMMADQPVLSSVEIGRRGGFEAGDLMTASVLLFTVV